MSRKSLATFTIDGEALDKAKEACKGTSLSAKVNDFLWSLSGARLTIEDYERMLDENIAEQFSLQDKINSLNEIEKQENQSNSEIEKLKNEQMEKEKEIRIEQYIEKIKGIIEVQAFKEEIKNNSSVLTDTKRILEFIVMLREKYQIKIGVVRLREVLLRL